MKPFSIFSIFSISIIFSNIVYSHCEIPCGIYGDGERLQAIKEHIGTIEKSMNEINQLSKEGDKNYNQLVRWIGNKEKHAEEIQHIVTQYFMTQRVKPANTDDTGHDKFVHQLTLLHKLLFHSMKSKQTTDLAHVSELKSALEAFQNSYLGQEEGSHKKHEGSHKEHEGSHHEGSHK